VIIDFHTHALARELSAKPGQVEGLLCTNLPAEDQIAAGADKIRLTVPVQLPLRGGIKRVEGWKQGGWTAPKQRHDPNLIRALALAHKWQAMIMKWDVRSIDELAKRAGQDRKHLQRLLRLACLAPDIQKDILTGRQPADLTLSKLTDGILPSA
jgi:site-specific DNA recombinase